MDKYKACKSLINRWLRLLSLTNDITSADKDLAEGYAMELVLRPKGFEMTAFSKLIRKYERGRVSRKGNLYV